MFSASEKSRTSPRRCRSSGMWPTPASRHSRLLSVVTSSPAAMIRPASGLRRPGDRLDELRSGRCRPPRRCRRSRRPAPRRRRRELPPGRARRGRCRSSTVRRGSPGSAGVFSTCRSTSRPTIRRARLSSVAPSRGTVSIVFPRRRTVIRSAISSTSPSLWVMKMIDFPSAWSERMIVEELHRLLRREDGRRLVEDEDLGASVERLQDLDALLHADRDRLDAGLRAHRQAEALGDVPDSLVGRLEVEEGPLVGLDRRARCSPPPSSPG